MQHAWNHKGLYLPAVKATPRHQTNSYVQQKSDPADPCNPAPEATHACRVLEMFSTVTSVKGVASPSLPTMAPTLLISASTRWPADSKKPGPGGRLELGWS